jgi:hypothetical protein
LLPLCLLFLFLNVLLLAFFLVLLATLVSHGSSLSAIMPLGERDGGHGVTNNVPTAKSGLTSVGVPLRTIITLAALGAVGAPFVVDVVGTQLAEEFEVPSIRTVESPRNYVRLQVVGDSFVAEGVTAAILIRPAFVVERVSRPSEN